MRHRIRGRSLSRDTEHQIALRRNMAASLFQHETISTTMPKAKEVKSFVEKLITLAKKGDLAARRRAISLLGNPPLVEQDENGEPIEKGTVVGKLFSELGPRFLDRQGGYTRIVKLSKKRLGDNGQLVLLQLLGADEKLEPKEKKAKAKAKPESEKVVETPEKVKQEDAETAPAETEEKAPETAKEKDQASEEKTKETKKE